MTIDFGIEMSESEAALYEAPFEYLRTNVKPMRDTHVDIRARTNWWRYGVPRIEMRQALTGISRYIGTSLTSQHRMFRYLDGNVLAENTVIVLARDDDYFFGILQSHIHTLWAEGVGSQLRESESALRYTPTTCFETFPLPVPDEWQRAAIAEAAGELNQLRENWLNPVDMLGEPALKADQRRRRTLTNLYNDNPTWLRNAHTKLDATVANAYGWPNDLSDEQILERLLALNLERAEAEKQDTRTEDAESVD